MRYSLNQDQARAAVEKAFNTVSSAENARLEVKNGQLELVPGRRGQALALDNVFASIETLLRTGRAKVTTIDVAEIEPAVTDAVAQQTKTEVEAALQPIYLQAENRNFTITLADLYGVVEFAPANGRLNWTLPDEKLRTLVRSKITSKINVKMTEKLIQSDTQQVVQQGRDGKAADETALMNDVRRTIAERINTKEAPIAIAVKTTPFTERTVAPDYIAGLFEGLYVDINLSKQRLFVMNGTVMTASYLISSGKRGTPTPVGLFYILNRHPMAQSRLFPGIWMEKWMAITTTQGSAAGYNGFGLHRVPYLTINGQLVRESLAHLGRPASHGCVRIADAGADWLYDNAPIGTPVNIHY